MERQQHGGDIYSNSCRIDFSASVNPLPMPEGARRAAIRGIDLSANYPDPECRELKAALSAAEHVPAAQMICGNGASELIYALVRALKPHRALLAIPCFSEYEAALRRGGCRAIDWYECRPETGYRMEEGFLDCITEAVDVIFLCNPANPTGTAIPSDLLHRIAGRCREKKVFLIADECFVPLMEEGPEDEVSLKDELPRMPGLFILRAFTKFYSMAGLRLGYGFCSDEEFLGRLRGQMQPWNVSIPAQMAGAAVLKDAEFAGRTRRMFSEEKRYLKSGLEELGLSCLEPAANYIFFTGPEDLGEKLAARGILIRDCSNYRGLRKGCWRTAVRTRQDNGELLKALKEILKK